MGEKGRVGRREGGRTHPAVHRESWIPAVCLPQTRGNLEHKRDATEHQEHRLCTGVRTSPVRNIQKKRQRSIWEVGEGGAIQRDGTAIAEKQNMEHGTSLSFDDATRLPLLVCQVNCTNVPRFHLTRFFGRVLEKWNQKLSDEHVKKKKKITLVKHNKLVDGNSLA